jgi:hypothetical protein
MIGGMVAVVLMAAGKAASTLWDYENDDNISRYKLSCRTLVNNSSVYCTGLIHLVFYFK